MSNDITPQDGPSETDIVGMLGIYADALVEHHGIAAPELTTTPSTSVPPDGSDGKAHDMAEEETTLDIDIRPLGDEKPRRTRVLVGAAAAAAALFIGGAAIVVQNDDSTDLAVAENAGVQEDAEEDIIEEPPEDQATVPAELDTTEAAEDAATGETTFGFGQGPGDAAVFANGEFVSLGFSVDGPVIARSLDGNVWETTPMVGLPESALPSWLTQTSAGWVVFVEVPVEGDTTEDFTAPFFGPDPKLDRFLATSTDLIEWTLTPLPEIERAEGESAWPNGFAVSGDTVAVLFDVQPETLDELQVLLSNGYVNEADFETFCTSDFDGTSYTAYSCVTPEDLDGASDDEALVELVVVQAGDPGFEDLVASFEQIDFETGTQVLLVGPIGGPYEQGSLPEGGFGASIHGSDSGFLASSFGPGGTVVHASPNGIDWTESAADGGFISESNGVLLNVRDVAFEARDGSPGVGVSVSSDGGVTWADATIDTDLFGAFGTPVGGPGGFAVLLEGPVGPVEDPFAQLGPLEIPKGDFVMVVEQSITQFSLRSVDGTVIHEPVGPEALFGTGLENVIRTEDFGNTIVWLDPETGEDLVSFDEADFDSAFEAEFGGSATDIAGDAELPDGFASEVWFSVDGITWNLLERTESESGPVDSFSAIAAVGDDEVLIRRESFVEPPLELLAFEEEGRDPTPEEMAALDEFFSTDGEGGVQWRTLPIG